MNWRCKALDKIIVTTALIYANGEIHLGHITSTYLPADIFVRFHRLRGDDVIHVGATDDFGTPILVEAERKGTSPEEFVAYWNETDQKDYADLGISFDIYFKTSSKENIELAQYFFKKLYERGYIFKKAILQPYCEKDKKFLPDRFVKGTCPYCGATDQYSDSCEQCGRTFEPSEILDPHCAICGSKPTSKESEHYFFKLAEFSDAVEKWLTENKNLQAEVKNYVLNWIKEGLRNWDISRDITWGVPIPLEEAKGKVLYVWFDNHICYISTALKFFAERGIDGKKAWNSSKIYHFIGKDIVYHHYLFLPAMRLGVSEFKLPDFIPTRGYFLLEGQKFSKSRGWYVSLRDYLNKFPPDYLRYYLAAITPYSQLDVNFDWEDFQKRINNELIANIGNFIHRSLTFIWTKYQGKVPQPQNYDATDNEFLEKQKDAAEGVGKEIESNELSKGLRKIVEFSAFCNQYFQKKQPWADKEKAKTCLYLCANAVRSLAILLEPYIPFSAEKLWQQLNLQGLVHEQDWNSALQLRIEGGHQIDEPRVLFQKISDEDIEEERQKLHKSAASHP
ncbi:MAG: methionine--tRNA ligase [Candidatus Bathyarchaeota archaeon]|nr:methionine--tRNA ligase [Candidatus Bathyarchaeota archaeon]